jgi:CBS domain-containing protein
MDGDADAGDTIAFLRDHAPFDRMRPEHLGFLAERLRPIRFAAGDAVTDPEAGPAEWFYILREGRILAEDQDEAGGGWDLGPGDCFPIGALAANRPVGAVQRAEADVVCLTMNRAAFEELRGLSAAFNDYCSNRLAGLVEKVGRQVRADAARDLGSDRSLDLPLSERSFRPPRTASPDTPIREALAAMSDERIGSVVVTDGADRPIGIFTLKDLLNRVALPGTPLDAPISRVMTPNPVSVPRSAFAFEAAMAMAHAGIQHICVVEDDRLVGVVSERDLFSMQRVGLVNLTKSIGRAGSTTELALLGRDVRQLVNQMIAQGVKVGQIAQIITLLNDQMVVRVIELEVAAAGGAPVPFTWLAFGSEGRSEQTLKTDQDNGMLFEAPEGMTVDAARALLLPLAERINRALDAIGFPLCTGNIMAQNPECCLSGAEWRARFTRWIDSTTPENLLNATIFFDFRPIWGPKEPAAELRRFLLDRVAGNALFRRQMAGNALRNAPPLGTFRDFRLSGAGDEQRTIDLKLNGVTPFVDAARILALSRKVAETNTAARLERAAAAGAAEPSDAAAWIEAYDYIRLLRMRLNEEQAAAGGALGNRIDPDRLNDLDRRILKEAFREARRLQQRLSVEYQL